MNRPVVVFYISGHGFGHASRQIEVMNALLAPVPTLRIIARTSVPAWFLESSARGAIEVEMVETDPGVRQIDSLRIDEEATVRDAAAFYRTFDARVDAEAQALDRSRASVVVGDIPPLAFAAAERAGVPSIALANFTWDWIYTGYPHFDADAPGVMKTIEDAYAKATIVLRLPLHGGFRTMPVTREIPLIARRSTRSRDQLRRLLGLDTSSPVVLASFGGHGAPLRYEEIARSNDLTIVVTDYESPGSASGLKRFSLQDLRSRGIRYEDLVRAADVVAGKAGYGIVSECIANSTAFLHTSRGRFIEHDMLLAEMPRMLRCRYIPPEDLLAGRWQDHVKALLAQSPPPETPPTNGAETAAEEILRRL